MRKRYRLSRAVSAGLMVVAMLFFAVMVSAADTDNRTVAFIGDGADVEGFALVLHRANPLFGGGEIYLSGSGDIIVVSVMRDDKGEFRESRYQFVDRERVASLIEEIKLQDLLEMPMEYTPRMPMPADWSVPVIALRNGLGEVQPIPRVFSRISEEFHHVLGEILSLLTLAEENSPVYFGDYDATYIPAGFEWSQPILADHKNVQWIAPPSEEALLQAEEDAAQRERQARETTRKKKQLQDDSK